eukprot:2807193-Pleurochrysis_carterae.AAC.1
MRTRRCRVPYRTEGSSPARAAAGRAAREGRTRPWRGRACALPHASSPRVAARAARRLKGPAVALGQAESARFSRG